MQQLAVCYRCQACTHCRVSAHRHKMDTPLRPEFVLRRSTYTARASRAMPPNLAIEWPCLTVLSTFPASPFLQGKFGDPQNTDIFRIHSPREQTL